MPTTKPTGPARAEAEASLELLCNEESKPTTTFEHVVRCAHHDVHTAVRGFHICASPRTHTHTHTIIIA